MRTTKTENRILPCALIAGLGLIPAGWLTAQTFTTLHSFTGNDGATPRASLILSGDMLYGTAQSGGSSGNGTLFALNTNGSGFRIVHSFTGGAGSGPNSLILSGNTLYGTTVSGGSAGNGTVFKLNADGTGFRILHSFAAGSGGFSTVTNSDGAQLFAGLTLVGNTLFGTAYGGGTSARGTVFSLNTDGTGFTNLHSFTPISEPDPGTGVTNSDGANPYARLVLSGNTLYGTAFVGGSLGNGTVFALNTNGTGFATVHSFDFISDGALPYGELVVSGTTLYGTTAFSVFKLNTDGTDFTRLHRFSATPNNTNSDGTLSLAGLILSGNTLYGTTFAGGSSGHGTLFAVNTDGTGFTNLHNFTAGSVNSDGAAPYAGLILCGNILYGTTVAGGSWGNGTIFKLVVNRVPMAVANVAPLFDISSANTNRFIIAPDNAAATVVLDGSQSSDADNDPLLFSWFADGQTNTLAAGAVATNQFALGLHTVTLIVSDGQHIATAQINFEVITLATAVGQLVLLVEAADLGARNIQPLLATLSATMSSFDRGDVTAALNQICGFMHQVRAQIAPWNPALASELIAACEQVITVVSRQ